MANLSLKHIYKVYPNGAKAVNDFNMQIDDKEFIVFVGPSGCGKSTTLRMIAGLEEITAGELKIGDTVVNGMEPKDRDIAMVFQNYALYPHMTIFENIAFGLRMRKVPDVKRYKKDDNKGHRAGEPVLDKNGQEIPVMRKYNKQELAAKVNEAAEILGITEYLKRKPKEMSGGQRQRVAMGRAIVRNPKLFLFDEPLSNLDAKLRGSMRREIMLLHKKLNATMMYVTHDQTEALTLADRIVCMSMGHVQQIGKPIELYEHPANTFVATFIGLPPMNMFEGKIDNGKFVCDLFEYPLNDEQKSALAEYEGQPVIMGCRPENITRSGSVKLTVTNNENLGMNSLIHGKIGGVKIVVAKFAEWCSFKEGDEIQIGFDEKMTHFFELPKTTVNEKGEQTVTEYGKAIR